MYLIHNEREPVVAERFIKTLKTKIYKYMTLVSKNMYIVKLDDTVDEYIIHIIEHLILNLLILKIIHILILKKNVMIEILNVKLVIMYEFLNTKIYLLKDTHQIGLKKFLSLVKLKIWFHGHMLLNIAIVKKLLEHFKKKNYKRLINKNLE